MVDQHADATAGPGGERSDRAGQVVDAVQRLDHDALDPQVVAPDPFDQSGVVDPLDPDPGAAGHPGRSPGHGHRAGRGASRAGGSGRSGRGPHKGHRGAVEQERGRQHRELTAAPEPILQRHRVPLLATVHRSAHRDDRAAEPAVRRLDHELALGDHVGYAPSRACGLGQDVGVAIHPSTLTAVGARPGSRHAAAGPWATLDPCPGPAMPSTSPTTSPYVAEPWPPGPRPGGPTPDRSSADEIIRAVTADDAPHRVSGLFDSDADQPLSAAVIDWRRRGQPVTLLLPVPGDLRGLPPEPDFRAAAVEAGSAVIGGGLALVPERIEYHPSSAPPTITWQAFEVSAPTLDYVAPAEAAYDLAEAIRASAAVLTRAGVGDWHGDGGERAARVRTSGDLLDLPPGYPGRAVSLIAQALRMRMLLRLAEDPAGGAVDLAGTRCGPSNCGHWARPPGAPCWPGTTCSPRRPDERQRLDRVRTRPRGTRGSTRTGRRSVHAPWLRNRSSAARSVQRSATLTRVGSTPSALTLKSRQPGVSGRPAPTPASGGPARRGLTVR